MTKPYTKEQIREKLTEILVNDFELNEPDIKDDANLFTDKKLPPEEFKEIRTIADVVNAVYNLI